MSPEIEIMILASIVSIACALPGVFMVLRRVSLMSDAISHAILLGIVLVFFAVDDLNSPFLILGAALTGLAVVTLTELLISTKKMKEDASIGLIFPVFFSLAIILISKYAGSIHLDTDSVLLGEIAFAPFDRLIAWNSDLGPKGWYVMGTILLLSIGFIFVFFKELKISTFDPSLAAALGFSPLLLHYGLMSVVSITAVGAFSSVGSILVVALMIAPPAAAYLLTQDLKKMILLSCGIGVLSSLLGYQFAHAFDANIAGAISMVAGMFFLLALLFSKERGLIAQIISYHQKRLLFASHLLLVHLLDHEGSSDEKRENTLKNAKGHMRWKESFAKRVVENARSKEWIIEKEGVLHLTRSGRALAREVMI